MPWCEQTRDCTILPLIYLLNRPAVDLSLAGLASGLSDGIALAVRLGDPCVNLPIIGRSTQVFFGPRSFSRPG